MPIDHQNGAVQVTSAIWHVIAIASGREHIENIECDPEAPSIASIDEK